MNLDQNKIETQADETKSGGEAEQSNRRNGKIASLPSAVREEINRRLFEGQKSPKVLAWLNALPEVQAVLAECFAGSPVGERNLSNWRTGGYRDWQEQLQIQERTKSLAEFSAKLGAAAGTDLNAGNSVILAGSIMQILQRINTMVESGKDDLPEERAKNLTYFREVIHSLSLSVARLRKGDHNAEARHLAREKFLYDAGRTALTQALKLRQIECDNTKSEKERINEARMLLFGSTPA